MYSALFCSVLFSLSKLGLSLGAASETVLFYFVLFCQLNLFPASHGRTDGHSQHQFTPRVVASSYQRYLRCLRTFVSRLPFQRHFGFGFQLPASSSNFILLPRIPRTPSPSNHQAQTRPPAHPRTGRSQAVLRSSVLLSINLLAVLTSNNVNRNRHCNLPLSSSLKFLFPPPQV
jgi:hypothetical protein